jgi:hypothetical protein
MTEEIQHIAPPMASDANSKSYPVKRAPNGVGKYVEISTENEKCDYWMYLLGTALAEKRKVKWQGELTSCFVTILHGPLTSTVTEISQLKR